MCPAQSVSAAILRARLCDRETCGGRTRDTDGTCTESENLADQMLLDVFVGKLRDSRLLSASIVL